MSLLPDGSDLLLLANRTGEWMPATFVGIVLVLFGAWLIRSHWRSWRSHTNDPALEPSELDYYRRQFRRRIQASGIILLLGVMIPVGDRMVPLNTRDASVATAYWLVVLVMTLWVLLLAMGDLVVTRAHSRLTMSRLRNLKERQQELQAEVERLRAQAGRRGSSTQSEDSPY